MSLESTQDPIRLQGPDHTPLFEDGDTLVMGYSSPAIKSCRLSPRYKADASDCPARRGVVKEALTRAAAGSVAMLMTIAAVTAGLGGLQARAQQASREQSDNYTWLEDIHGERPMAWVKAENARTAAVIENDTHFSPLEAEALEVLESPDRLPGPQ